MHPLVAATVVEAYSIVGSRHRGRQWQYGDLGLKQGGELWPHKTHQSGVLADFFFPVIDAAGAPAQIPISVLNDFGYGVDFDAQGRFEALRIDWKAMVDHWLALEAAGKGRGVAIRRIILAPSLQKTLLKKETRAAAFVKRFNKRRAWVVHDEHYHIDFSIPAHLRKPLSCR